MDEEYNGKKGEYERQISSAQSELESTEEEYKKIKSVAYGEDTKTT